MSLLKALPLRYRLPLIHGTLRAIGHLRRKHWTRAEDSHLRAGPLVVSGFFRETIGIARAAHLTADALEAAGLNPIRHDLRPCFGHILNPQAQLAGDNRGVWLIHANAPEAWVAFLSHRPDQWSQRYRIGIWAWETPKAPAYWAEAADYLHEIWVPSRFVHDALCATFIAAQRPHLTARLRVMPHPYHRDTAPLPEPQRFGLDQGLCHVLSLFDTKSSAARKNPWAAIESWQKAFPAPSGSARLTLKVQDLADDPVSAARLKAILAERPDIRLFTDHLSDADMDRFIASFDVLMSLHRSEGFGLSLLEAMMSGVAVIATGWSGNTDFMTPENARLIGYRLIPLTDKHGAYSALRPDPAQVWAEADTDQAALALRGLCADAALRQTLSHEARKVAAQVNAHWSETALKALPFAPWLSA